MTDIKIKVLLIAFAALLMVTRASVLHAPNFGTCVINLDDNSGKIPPLLWSPHTKNFLWPERILHDQRIIDFDVNEEVLVVCHAATDAYPTEISGFNTSNLLLKCTEEGSFVIESSTKVDVSSLTCTDRHEPWLIIEDGSKCALESVDAEPIDELSLIQVGWKIDQSFAMQYKVCQDTKHYITLWSEYIINGEVIDMRDTVGNRPFFQRDVRGQNRTFVDFQSEEQLLECFKRKWQEKQVIKLLGHNAVPWSGDPIVDNSDSSQLFMSRGHLTPAASFVYRTMQFATFFVFNVAHHYQSFNGGNWNILEMAVRELAHKHGHDLVIRTGTFGILSFLDVSEVDTDLNMFTERELFLPVPKYFWKTIYDPSEHEAIAFIGLNNPHIQPGHEPNHLCQSICSQLQWLKLHDDNIVKGLMQCCRVEELKEIIEYLPNLKHDDLGWPQVLKN